MMVIKLGLITIMVRPKKMAIAVMRPPVSNKIRYTTMKNAIEKIALIKLFLKSGDMGICLTSMVLEV
jgi:hypothetical protein